MTDYKIPTEVEAAVLTRVFEQAAEADWLNLQDGDRTRLYQQWTDDPEVGGRLIGFVGLAANVRPWLKDGPMKEYQRARRGVGKYAKYVKRPAATIDEIIAKTLGGEWEIVPRSKRQKPMRAKVRRVGSEDDELHFVAGPDASFKHLVWPATLDRSGGETAPWTICVIDPFLNPLTREDKAQHERLAKFLGVRVIYFNEM
ncbi:hypothetical protein OHB49_11410 [Streptomyces sp. NBC_01717]|uniref:hypothetical protein n=1 Tax=Streptomyces sp. NBC_01717 TaxID=2975918 RepID=UPI002E34200B|nr:hypothetical protein [Streptomyces sp. NBC_01717]